MQRMFVAAAIVLAGAIGASAGGAEKPSNIAGTWQFSVDVGDTHGTPVFVFKQKGGALTGTVTNPRGHQPITGSVDGTQAVFGFEVVRDGQTSNGVYRGTVESKKKMSGTVDFTGALVGSGTWTAVKK